MKKYNMSAIMRRAWEIVRNIAGEIRARLSKALRMAWAEAKQPAGEIVNGWNVTALEKAGAARWTKYGKDRMYVKKTGRNLLNLVINWRRSGSIESATLNGEEISNSYAGSIEMTYDSAYIDLKTGEICGVSDRADMAEEFTSKLIAAFRA